MRIIIKSIGITIFNLICLFLLTLLFDNMASLISGYVFSGFDVKNWWYEFISYNKLNYLIATAVLSGLLFIVNEITVYYARSRIKLFLGTVIGCISVLVITVIYWNYIQTYCFSFEWASLEEAFSISLGSYTSQVVFWAVYSGLMFCTSVFTKKFDLLIGNKERKITWHQVYSGEDFFCRMLYIGVPYTILIAGTYFIVGVIGLLIKKLFLIFTIASILMFFSVHNYLFSVIKKYYQVHIINPLRVKNLVIVQESQYVGKSFFVHHLCKNHLFKKMEEKGIWFFPSEIGYIPEIFIKLDIYDEWMFMRTAAQKSQVFSSMSNLRGTFNIAFTSSNVDGTIVNYDVECSEIGCLISQIEKFAGYLDYRRIITNTLNSIDLSKLKNENFISEEIADFKSYMETLTDDFQSFDYAIKWMEIVNYLFALVGFSKCCQPVFNEKKKIVNADFGRWRSIVNNNCKEDNELSLIMNTEFNDAAFKEFENLWSIITNREYHFELYTVQNLLDGVRKIRNYTRGHGVFTFEISQSINISLIKILAYLINRFVDYLNTTDNIENLEELGWVIFREDVPYYLYSVEKKSKDYLYNSFEMGSSIYLPSDTFG